MHSPAKDIILGLWSVVGVIWLVGALAVKRTARTQSAGSRLFHIALAAFAFMVGFSRRFAFGPLVKPFVPDLPVIVWTGVALAALGTGFAVWARFWLGRNWSGTITVKERHTLKTDGPYALVRHPIYSGLLLGLLGTALGLRELRMLICTGLMLLLFIMKARMEEQFMMEEFGPQYEQYRRRVRALIPLVY